METRNYQVYIHQNKINGKMYCGQTCRPLESRFLNGKGYDDCPKFYNAILKYGWDGFNHFSLIDGLTHEEANIVETEIIKKYNLTDDHFGYNISEGGAHSAPPIKDLTDQTFGRLTVLKRDVDRPGIYWLCECSCDEHNIVSVHNGSLLSGATTSCGCYHKEVLKMNQSGLIHGMSKSPLYNQWKNLMNRQDAKDNIVSEWYDRCNFFDWAKQSGYEEGRTLLRIDRHKPYSPDNCRWGTAREYKQSALTKKKKLYEYNGELYTIRELSALSDIPVESLSRRLKGYKSKTVDDALLKPLRKHEDRTNTYQLYDDYMMVHMSNGYFIVDFDVADIVQQYMWVEDGGYIVTNQTKDKKRLHLLSIILDIQPNHIHKVQINFRNGDCFDYRKSNIECVLRNDSEAYKYYLSHITVSGIALEGHIWRIGKKKEPRKNFNNLGSALQYYDQRYGTSLYEDYVRYCETNVVQ